MNSEDSSRFKRNPRSLGFLSGAPRVTTRGGAEAGGPRSHVLGTISGFRSLGWEVREYIFGDQVFEKASKVSSEKVMASGAVARAIVDAARIGLGRVNRRKAWARIGTVDWVYERLASFQALGARFQRQGIPWILESNGPFFYEARTDRKAMVLSGIARRIELGAYRSCNVIVCISEPLKDLIVEVSGVSREKVLVLPNGVDTTFFDPDGVKPRRLHDDVTIGFVGTLTEWQRLDLLIDSVAELRRYGFRAAVTIVGDGLSRHRWEAHSLSRGLGDVVTFVGRVPRDDVPAYIAGFDIGYSGPGRSGLGTMYHSPLKLYEYMAMSKPVIAADYDDANKLVRGKNTGFLFEPESGESLKRTLRDAIEQSDGLSDMGELARAEIVKSHSWTQRISTLVRDVDDMLSEQRPSGALGMMPL